MLAQRFRVPLEQELGAHRAAVRRLSTDRHALETTPAVEWLDIRYEDLVGDLEGQARRLIDFVGLEWDPACLEFHSTKRVVRTPSLLQVRQPIHSQSIGRWKNYAPSLNRCSASSRGME